MSRQILQVLRRVVEDSSARELPDAELLRRFVHCRDDAAFLAILRRHGPMVLGVCRALLPNDADVEDAFQATFLVFARQAGSIRESTSVASWLHGVAQRTAWRARTAFARRHKHEARFVRPEAATADALSWPEARQVLHEELGALSERYRAPLTLHYLQGKTLDESAVQLGLAKSTLKVRLERGREVLRARLVRRGLGSAGVLLAAAWPEAQAAVPAALFEATRTVALTTASGTSPSVLSLADGVWTAMRLARLKTPFAVAMVLTCVGLGLLALPATPEPAGGQAATPAGRREAKTAPHLVLKTGPEESVTSVAVSPDGTLVASSSFDGRLRLHDAKTGEIVRAFGAADDLGGRRVVFAPDGRSVALAGFHMDKVLRTWDVRTGAVGHALKGHTEWETYAIAYSPDGKLLASAGVDKQVLVWDLASGEVRHRFAQPLAVSALAFSPDNATLAGGGGEKIIHLWNMKTGKGRTLEGHHDWISALAFSRDGATLASGSCDWGYHRGRDTSRFAGSVPAGQSEWKVWDVATGTLKRGGTEPGRLLSLAFTPDGKAIACGLGNTVRAFDLADGSGRSLASHDGVVTAFAFTPDGGSLVVGGHDRTVKRVVLKTKTVQWTVPGYWEQVNAVALSPDARFIATGSGDLRFSGFGHRAGGARLGPGAARLWEAPTGRLLRQLGESVEQVLAVEFSRDGRHLAAGGGRPDGSGFVHVWDSATGAEVWSAKDHAAAVLALAYAPDNNTLASADANGFVKLRDSANGRITFTTEGDAGGANAVAFSADSVLAVGAGDGTITLWDWRGQRRLRTLRPPPVLRQILAGNDRYSTSVAFTPDGRTVAACSSAVAPANGEHPVRLWDTRTGEVKRDLTSEQTRSRFVAISPDGKTLATNGVGKAIHLYNLQTGELLRALTGHGHPPTSGDFSADGRILVSGGDFRTTKVWEVGTGRLLATLVTFGGDDWLSYTPDGFYEGSAGIDRYLGWRIDGDLRTPETLAKPLHRPDILKAALSER